ncbi:unnamed protein product, partial [Ascophyllum nodosum]
MYRFTLRTFWAAFALHLFLDGRHPGGSGPSVRQGVASGHRYYHKEDDDGRN